MDFDQFGSLASKIEKIALPGEQAQYKFAPIERLHELKAMAVRQQTAKQAAVLVLFYPGVGRRTHFVLILRKSYKGVHSNQVGFPGGKVEPGDDNLQQTALREAEEEVGVRQTSVRVLKTLTEIYVPPSNFMVYPFLGITTTAPNFERQEDEVEAILQVPVADLLDDQAIVSKVLSTSYAASIKVPAFELGGQTVWGATGMILSEVREVLRAVV